MCPRKHVFVPWDFDTKAKKDCFQMLSCICPSHPMNQMFFIEDEILYGSHKLPERIISAGKREMQRNSEWRESEGQ